jgi:capsular polysaccharide biosynthesis protein
MNEFKEKNDFDSTDILMSFYKWRKQLIIIAVVAIITSTLFSSPWFITPKFKSTVILFPTSTNAISKALISENSKEDILEFGEEEQAEQVLQMLNSNEIRSRIVKKFNLMQHYNIDSTSQFKNTNLFDEWNDNITFKRTEFMAVEINVLDKEPQMAADIANNIAALLDSTKNKMQRERAMKGFKIVEEEYLSSQNYVKSLEDSLTQLRKLGINDYETQSEAFNVQLAIALSKNNNAGVKAIEEKIKVLSQYGGAYVSIRDALEHEKKQLSAIKEKYQEAKIDAMQNLPAAFIVNSAYKAEKKASPIRWLIVVISTMSSVLLAWIIIIGIEKIKNNKV